MKIESQQSLRDQLDRTMEKRRARLSEATISEAIARAQKMTREHFAGRSDVSVDDFLAQRRADAERE